MIQKIFFVFLISIAFASSCKERSVVTIEEKSSKSNLDTVTVGDGERIDTAIMIYQTHKVVKVGNDKNNVSIEEYRSLFSRDLSNMPVASSLSARIKILADNEQLTKLVYFSPVKHESDGSYAVRHVINCIPVYLYNISNEVLDLYIHNDKLRLVTEAKNERGVWKPIEYMIFDKYAYNSGEYLGERIFLLPKHFLTIKAPKFTGNFNTELRLKLIQNGDTTYSNTFDGAINLEQFKIPEYIRESSVSSFMFQF